MTARTIAKRSTKAGIALQAKDREHHCKICGIALVSREKISPSSPHQDEVDRRLSLHHIDYQKNIAIRVCPSCHVKLHNALKNHKYGINNVIRRDGSKRGPITPGKYPKRILEDTSP